MHSAIYGSDLYNVLIPRIRPILYTAVVNKETKNKGARIKTLTNRNVHDMNNGGNRIASSFLTHETREHSMEQKFIKNVA